MRSAPQTNRLNRLFAFLVSIPNIIQTKHFSIEVDDNETMWVCTIDERKCVNYRNPHHDMNKAFPFL